MGMSAQLNSRYLVAMFAMGARIGRRPMADSGWPNCSLADHWRYKCVLWFGLVFEEALNQANEIVFMLRAKRIYVCQCVI